MVLHPEDMRTLGKIIKGIIFSIIPILLYSGLNNAVRRFTAVFKEYEADLPFVTQIIMISQGIYVWLVLWNLFVFMLWLGSLLLNKKTRLSYKWVRIHFYLGIALFVMVMVAMYLPVFSLV